MDIVVPGNSQLQWSIIGSDMPSALGLVTFWIQFKIFDICYPKGAHSLGHHGGQLPNESNSSKLTDWFIHIPRPIICMVSMGKAMYMGSSQTR